MTPGGLIREHFQKRKRKKKKEYLRERQSKGRQRGPDYSKNSVHILFFSSGELQSKYFVYPLPLMLAYSEEGEGEEHVA